MNFEDIENDIIDSFNICVENNIRLPRSFYMKDTLILKSIDEIDKHKMIIEYISIITRLLENEKYKKFYDNNFFFRFLEYFDIEEDNVEILRSIFLLFINIPDIFDIFFSKYQNYVTNDISFICSHIINLSICNIKVVKTIVSECNDENFNIIKEGILSHKDSNRLIKYCFFLKDSSNDYTNKRNIYVHYHRFYVRVLTELIFLKSKIKCVSKLSKDNLKELNFFLNKVLAFDNFENIDHYYVFMYVRDIIEYIFRFLQVNIKNPNIVKNLLGLGCDISKLNIFIDDIFNFVYKFKQNNDPSVSRECMLIKRNMHYDDWRYFISLEYNNIHPSLRRLWDKYWMDKAIKDFKDKDIDAVIWKDFIENKDNLSYKKRYNLLEMDLYYRPGGEGNIKAFNEFKLCYINQIEKVV